MTVEQIGQQPAWKVIDDTGRIWTMNRYGVMIGRCLTQHLNLKGFEEVESAPRDIADQASNLLYDQGWRKRYDRHDATWFKPAQSA